MLGEEILVKELVRRVVAQVKFPLLGADDSHSVELEEILDRYLFSVYRWSDHLQFLGMGAPIDTDDCSVPLSYHPIPRRFRGQRDSKTRLLNESEVLLDSYPYLILGDPGSGKTTTVKRLIRILMKAEPLGPEDTFRTPVLIKLREVKAPDEIYLLIAKVIGLPIERFRDSDDHHKVHRQIWGKPVKSVVGDLLDNTDALVFFDGLDEASPQLKATLYSEIENLAKGLRKAKLIVTCRSGEYYRTLEGFKVLDIEPLTKIQIRAIAGVWLKEPDRFLSALQHLPYQDIIDRPLLLTSLMFLYKRSGRLPEQPNQVYKRVVRLLLEEWDEQRGINRASKYSRFDSERKLEFLASVAFNLSYLLDTNHFSSETLVECYEDLRETFGLPAREAEMVCREIESHNGLMIRIGDGYEFSHLSLQEFLAAYHMVRAPFSPITSKYLRKNPEPVAVAIAISSNPSKWFAGLILHDEVVNSVHMADLERFLARLTLESPFFSPDSELGFAVVKLLNRFWKDGDPESALIFDRLFQLANVHESLLSALTRCTIVNPIYKDFVLVSPDWTKVDQAHFTPDVQWSLPKRHVKNLIKANELDVQELPVQ